MHFHVDAEEITLLYFFRLMGREGLGHLMGIKELHGLEAAGGEWICCITLKKKDNFLLETDGDRHT